MTPRSKPCCGNRLQLPKLRSAARPSDGFHATTLQGAPHGAFRSGKCAIDRSHEHGVALLDDDARKTAQDHLDPARLIDAAPRPVRILDPDTDALDGTGKLAELRAELASDMGTLVCTDVCGGRTDIRGDHRGIRAARRFPARVH